MDSREQQIRERAHAIWEAEGHPHGHDDEHWQRAERELASLDAEGLPTPDDVSAIDPAPEAQHSPTPPLEPEAPYEASTPVKAPPGKKPRD